MLNKYSSRLFIAACFLWLISINTTLYAQTRLAIDWQPETTDKYPPGYADALSQTAVKLVILQPENKDVAQALDAAGIPFLVNTGLSYFTINEIELQKEVIPGLLQGQYRNFENFDNFSGFVLFNHSQSYKNSFQQLEKQLINEIGPDDSLRFFNVLKNELIETISTRPLGTFFRAKNVDKASIHAFADSTQSGSTYLIVPSDWYFEALEEYPALKEALAAAENVESAVIPLPVTPLENVSSFNWPIFLLLLLWAGLAANMLFDTTYRNAISRYFFSRSFFIEDVLLFRERSSLSGLFLLLQHAVSGGLIAYFLTKLFISEIGIQTFFHHLPYLAIFGDNTTSLFFIVFLLITALQFVAVSWLYLFNSSLDHFSQALNIYTWIYHVDFILITIAAALYYSGAAPYWLISVGILYFLIWFNNFNLSAFDASKKLGAKRSFYRIITVGIHSAVAAVAVILLLIYNNWFEIFNLITNV